MKNRDGKTQKGYKLNEFDLIKLGRVEYRVTEVKINENDQPKQEYFLDDIKEFY